MNVDSLSHGCLRRCVLGNKLLIWWFLEFQNVGPLDTWRAFCYALESWSISISLLNLCFLLLVKSSGDVLSRASGRNRNLFQKVAIFLLDWLGRHHWQYQRCWLHFLLVWVLWGVSASFSVLAISQDQQSRAVELTLSGYTIVLRIFWLLMRGGLSLVGCDRSAVRGEIWLQSVCCKLWHH